MKKKLVEAFIWTCAVVLTLLGVAGAMVIISLITLGFMNLKGVVL